MKPTIEELKESLERARFGMMDSDHEDRLSVALDELATLRESLRWRTYPEGRPEVEEREYLVTVELTKRGGGVFYAVRREEWLGYWCIGHVVAWMPVPDPYIPAAPEEDKR